MTLIKVENEVIMMKEINEFVSNLNKKIEFQLSEELVLSNLSFVAEFSEMEKKLEQLYGIK